MNRSRFRFTAFTAVLLMVALALAGCGKDKSPSTSAGGAKTTVTIAYVGPLTGDAANLGINIRDGAKTAIDAYNKSGGKYTVVLKEFDTKGDPAEATTVKDQYINDSSIIGLVGPAFSGETKAVIPALQEAGLVMVSASATNKALPDIVPNSTVFHRVIADDTFQGQGIGEYIAGKLSPKSIVVVDDNSEYGKGLADDTTKAITAKGGKVAKRVTLDPKAADFSAAVNDAKSASPDVVMYAGYYQEAGRLKKQLTDAGVKATFISGDGSLDPGFVTSAGAAAEGALLSCPCNLANDASTGKLGDFYNAYKTLNGKEPGTYSPEAYDVAQIYIKGITAGNTTRAKLLNFVEKDLGTYEGISKTIEFQDNGNIKTPSLFVFEVKGGKIVAKS
ncbi:MAG TPA: branched-chain amino acid ABC transporter substrate-binding protein [Acidimicrobiales bacterium]|jgi:branched-chain amino acid transport system substrate-binding protein|nr:branched-chain amino acid ABC transporter substrate-binding protein [Acidimicrobiales bacterium]